MNKQNQSKGIENEVNSATGNDILPKTQAFSQNFTQNQDNEPKGDRFSPKVSEEASEINKIPLNSTDPSKAEEISLNSAENPKTARNFSESEDNPLNSEEIDKNTFKSAEVAEISDSSAQKPLTADDYFTKGSENELKAQFPTVELEKLKNNKDFVKLLDLIIQNPTLSQIYSCFNSIVASAEEKSRERLTHALASAEAGVGSLSSSSPTEQAFFTKEQVLRMTQEEIRKNYVKIRQSQQLW